jgi:hypothetical protein
MSLETGWPALIRNTRNIGDFRRWKTHDVYQQAFDRLLRDLKAESGQPHLSSSDNHGLSPPESQKPWVHETIFSEMLNPATPLLTQPRGCLSDGAVAK